MPEPVASRPDMPEYGLLPPGEGGGLLPWSWGRQRLVTSHNYWLSTAGPEGAPHAAAVWGVWRQDELWCSTAGSSRKARNLAGDPRCVVTTESAAEAVIVHGVARAVAAHDVPGEVYDAYAGKYATALDPALGVIVAVTPRVAFGFVESGDEQSFVGTATRWTFP